MWSLKNLTRLEIIHIRPPKYESSLLSFRAARNKKIWLIQTPYNLYHNSNNMDDRRFLDSSMHLFIKTNDEHVRIDSINIPRGESRWSIHFFAHSL